MFGIKLNEMNKDKVADDLWISLEKNHFCICLLVVLLEPAATFS